MPQTITQQLIETFDIAAQNYGYACANGEGAVGPEYREDTERAKRLYELCKKRLLEHIAHLEEMGSCVAPLESLISPEEGT